jgi:uncharacterized protein YkwD
MAALVLGVGLTAITTMASDAMSAESASPRVLSVELDPPAIVGRPAELRVTAMAGKAPVSGVAVRFGREESFGLSACLAGSSGAPRPPDPFAPGSRVRFAVPHTFRRTGPRGLLVRVDAGGCGAPGASVFQPLIVTPTRPGEPVVPPTVLPAPLPGPGVPPVPGADDLPPSPGSARRLRCPGGSARVGRSDRSLRAARRSVLCLLNVQRRRHGLRRLRASAELRRAATAHSHAMVVKRFFGHVAPAGPSLVARVRRAHYLDGAGAWTVGENIGYGRWPNGTPASMVRSWMRSTAHRANILRRGFSSVGIGIVRGVPGNPRAKGATYTTDFGARRR